MYPATTPDRDSTRVTRRAALRAIPTGIAAGTGLLTGCQALSSGNGMPVEHVAANLEVPWALAFSPSGDLYVTERPGRITRVSAGDSPPTTVATLPETAPRGEGGLLGLALHPSFPGPPWLYTYQTYRDGDLLNRILRLSRTTDGEFERDRIVLDGIPGGRIHDGGRLGFGPDGALYASTGDSGEKRLAQDPRSLAGKILRLDQDGSVPADNPFDGSPTWSYGHRNPEGLAWQPDTGRLYSTEHGSTGHDELNLVRRGRNYGWPRVTGSEDRDQFEPPVLESGNGTWAPAGATFYAGDRHEPWQGDFFFATLGFSPGAGRRSLHRVRFGSDGTTVRRHERLLRNRFGRLRAVAQGPEGSLYVSTSNRDGRGDPARPDDRILRLRPGTD